MKHQDHKRRTANTHGTPAPMTTHRLDGRRWCLLALLILAFAVFPAVFAFLPLISRHRLLGLATSKPDLPERPIVNQRGRLACCARTDYASFQADDRTRPTFLIRLNLPTRMSDIRTGSPRRFPLF
jgi:hypothetical protein